LPTALGSTSQYACGERSRAPEPPDKTTPPDSPTDQIRRLNFISVLGHTDLRTTQRYLSTTQVRTVSASKAVVSALTQAGLQTARHSAHKLRHTSAHALRHTGTPNRKRPSAKRLMGAYGLGSGWVNDYRTFWVKPGEDWEEQRQQLGRVLDEG